MAVTKSEFVTALSSNVPSEILEKLVDEYLSIKQNLLLSNFSPSELNGGRFSECVIRLIQHVSNPPFTPFGQHLAHVDQIIRQAEGNTMIHESMRIYIPRLTRVLMDVRNRRNVAHVGGDVDPNYSDSLLVSQVSDWILMEVVRLYYNCSVDAARTIVESINQVHIPVIFNHNGFLKVQNSTLAVREKILVLLYYCKPKECNDNDLIKWTKYSNHTRFKKSILAQLDSEALIHYDNGLCILTTRGVVYVETHLNMEIIV